MGLLGFSFSGSLYFELLCVDLDKFEDIRFLSNIIVCIYLTQHPFTFDLMRQNGKDRYINLQNLLDL